MIGNGQAIAWDSSYVPVGRMFINADLELTSMDSIYSAISTNERFANIPCMFLSWEHGQPILTAKLLITESVELNCETGLAEQQGEQIRTSPVFQYTPLTGRERLQAFLGRDIERVR